MQSAVSHVPRRVGHMPWLGKYMYVCGFKIDIAISRQSVGLSSVAGFGRMVETNRTEAPCTRVCELEGYSKYLRSITEHYSAQSISAVCLQDVCLRLPGFSFFFKPYWICWEI